MQFYGKFMGTATKRIEMIDIVAIRKGNQLTQEECNFLINLLIETEIGQALKDTGDLKARGMDVYGAKFFMSTWSIVKKYFIVVVLEFFEEERMFKVINSTLVILVLKTSAAKTIKEYRTNLLMHHHI